MINNTNQILSQNLRKYERILMEYIEQLVCLDEQGELK